MRGRYIKPEFFKHERLAQLGPMHQILFEGLWCLADKEGRLQDRPLRIKAEILPYYEVDVDKMLGELASNRDRFIVRYEVDGERYIEVRNFRKHQTPHSNEKPSALPKPPDGSPPKTPAETSASSKDESTSPNGRSTSSIGESASKSSNPNIETGVIDSGVPEEFFQNSFVALAARRDRLIDQVGAVYAHYRTYHSRAAPKLTSDSREYRHIRKRLLEGSSVRDLCQAIDGCHRSRWHGGENRDGRKQQHLDLIVRTADNVTRFREMAEVETRDEPYANLGVTYSCECGEIHTSPPGEEPPARCPFGPRVRATG